MTSAAERLTLGQARRIALAAQGFADPRPAPGPATTRHLQRVVDRVGIVQIDSVNVLTRSHYLPFFSRLGPYDTGAARPRPRPGAAAPGGVLGARGQPRPAEHVAVAQLPDEAGAAATPGAGCSAWPVTTPSWCEAVLAEVAGARADHLPRASSERWSTTCPASTTEWGWNWSLVKAALEHLFWAGQISSAGRTAQFERRYAALERVLPRSVAAQAWTPEARPSDEDAFRELMRIAARAHGVGTEQDLRDYFRLKPEQARPALADAGGRRGAAPGRRSRGGAARHTCTATRGGPRRVHARGAAQPVRLADLAARPHRGPLRVRLPARDLRPAPQRVHGYYVLPFLYGDTLVARVDLKADRAAGRLRVHVGPLGARRPAGGRPPRWSASSGSWPTGSVWPAVG